MKRAKLAPQTDPEITPPALYDPEANERRRQEDAETIRQANEAHEAREKASRANPATGKLKLSEDKLKVIGDEIAKTFLSQWEESKSEISDAILDSIKLGQANDTSGSFTASIGVKLDWEQNSIVVALGFSRKFKNEDTVKIPDPDQPDLPGLSGKPETQAAGNACTALSVFGQTN